MNKSRAALITSLPFPPFLSSLPFLTFLPFLPFLHPAAPELVRSSASLLFARSSVWLSKWME